MRAATSPSTNIRVLETLINILIIFERVVSAVDASVQSSPIHTGITGRHGQPASYSQSDMGIIQSCPLWLQLSQLMDATPHAGGRGI
jgi:hypothetical protein